MFIEQITDKQLWEDFLQSIPITEKSFLHSWNWSEFQIELGNKIWRLGIYEKKSIIGIALIIKMKAKRGTFLLCPHGPYLKNRDAYAQLFSYLKELAKNENASFIRISPYLDRTLQNEKLFTKNGFIRSPIHTHAERTWLLDITPHEETLLKNMRKTTRYCIKKAINEKKLITDIKHEILDIHITLYLQLQEETKKRHRWTPYSETYIRKQIQTFSSNKEVSIIIVKYEKKPLAAAIVFYWQNIGFYFHGASSNEYPKLNAPYLVQWEAIQEGKRRGCKMYNFWGIADLDSVPDNHPWHGITQFKKGFGGFERKLVHSYDLPISPTYWITYAIEKIRKWKRRL